MTKFAITTDLHIGNLHFETHFMKLPSIFSDVAPGQVDAVLCAGDFTTSGWVGIPIDAIVNEIERLVQAPVFFVPGNHDYYGQNTFEERNESLLLTCPNSVILPGHPKTFGDDIVICGGCGWYPLDDVTGPAWASCFPDSRWIGMGKYQNDVAAFNHNMRKELAQIEADIVATKTAGKNVVVMTHVPGVSTPNMVEADAFFKNVELEQVLSKHQPDLIISGHTHRPISDTVRNHYNCPWGYSSERNYPATIIEMPS